MCLHSGFICMHVQVCNLVFWCYSYVYSLFLAFSGHLYGFAGLLVKRNSYRVLFDFCRVLFDHVLLSWSCDLQLLSMVYLPLSRLQMDSNHGIYNFIRINLSV